jgi:hypothetical protein
VVTVGVTPCRQPADPQPPSDGIPRNIELPGQVDRAVLVAAQTHQTPVRLAAVQLQMPQQPLHHSDREPVGPLRRLEALRIDPLCDLRRAEPLAAPRLQPLDQPRYSDWRL